MASKALKLHQVKMEEKENQEKEQELHVNHVVVPGLRDHQDVLDTMESRERTELTACPETLEDYQCELANHPPCHHANLALLDLQAQLDLLANLECLENLELLELEEVRVVLGPLDPKDHLEFREELELTVRRELMESTDLWDTQRRENQDRLDLPGHKGNKEALELRGHKEGRGLQDRKAHLEPLGDLDLRGILALEAYRESKEKLEIRESAQSIAQSMEEYFSRMERDDKEK